MATSRLIKKVGKDRINAVQDVLRDIQELLKKDLEGLYSELLKDEENDWAQKKAVLIGQAKATKNLINLIKTGE